MAKCSTACDQAESPTRLRHASRRRARLTLLLVIAAACAPRRPVFVEPDWGDAPAPYPSEITEITREYRHCADRCTFEQLVLRRDGRATRRFVTAGRVDSMFTARIDSLTFVRLVVALDSARLFQPMIGAGEQVPLAVDSYLVSAASLCRRAITTWSPLAHGWTYATQAVLAIERAIAALRWQRQRSSDFQVSLRVAGDAVTAG